MTTSPKDLNILFVEDEEDLVLVLDMSFKMRDDLHCKIVKTGEEALEYLEYNKVDLVISDHYLPNMVGVDLLEIIKVKYPKVKRYLITGSVSNIVFEDARMRAEPEFIFEKPVIVDDIIDKIFE